MLIIPIEGGENIEKALKRYRNKCDKMRLRNVLRNRQYYTKPSVKRRQEIQKAIYTARYLTKHDIC